MKLKRGQKLCKNCQSVNAARQRVCIDCGKAFQLKNTPIKNEIKDWKSLEKGETFRVINGTGSYYLLTRDCGEGEKGEKLFVGPNGKYEVKKIFLVIFDDFFFVSFSFFVFSFFGCII